LRLCKIAFLASLAIVGLSWGCSRPPDKTSVAPEKAVAVEPAIETPPPVDVSMDDKIVFEFAIYLTKPDADALGSLDKLLATKFTKFKRVETIAADVTEPTLAAKLIADVQDSYAPPSRESLEQLGHGLSPEQIEELQKVTQAVALDFAYSKEHVWDGMRSALELTAALARETDGVVWDEQTSEVFTPTAWEEVRLGEWTDGVPDMGTQTVMHDYQKDQYMRAITIGMSKFGLPDIVMQGFSRSSSHDMEQIVNLFEQALAEGAKMDGPSEFDLKVKAVKNAKVREAHLKSLRTNGTGVAQLSLREGTWEEGDPQNRLVEITFDRYSGPDVHARQHKMISGMFGSEGLVVQVEHDEALRAASLRAIEKLPALRTTFNAGLQPTEVIQVKAPFETPEGGSEWMWVEVTGWKGDDIEGHLRNEPRQIPKLHAGQIVHVSQAMVLDYIHKLPDGKLEGNETSQIIEKNAVGR
jgi:uncharacterized protein YegJ (DUF2314 family)